MSPFLAELLGTMLLILMGGGVVANVCLSKTKGNGAGWIAITTAWALGVFIGVVVAGPYSGYGWRTFESGGSDRLGDRRDFPLV